MIYKSIIFFLGLMFSTTYAMSVSTTKFTEKESLASAYDVVIGDVLDVLSVSKGKCFSGVYKIRVLSSFANLYKVGDIVELALTQGEIIPIVGESYLSVINHKNEKFYSWCKKPNLNKLYNADNLLLVYRAEYARLFVEDGVKKVEFNKCNKRNEFLYEDKYSRKSVSDWKDRDGKACIKLIADYKELENFISEDFPKMKK